MRRRARRAASVPSITYPPDLPVSERRAEIARVIADHQVVILCGQTGSGKTTQIPKICLEIGRGVGGMIGHTQPRRIAARAVAARIAYELGSPTGRIVGYKVRFGDRTGPETLTKVMTDGVLLAETQSDRLLEQYDTLIIDEAHERSLNIDFLLGYLRNLLPRRPDLKVIITSATIDPGRFADHFACVGLGGERRPAPIIEVSGRTHAVDIRYLPPESAAEDGGVRDDPDEDEPDMQELILRAVDEVCGIDTAGGPRDILIFLSGEREIRETAESLRKHHAPATPRGARGALEILPLYARLSAEEQSLVFAQSARGGARRVVLATNVAETSLTVPGIRFVIDPGFARLGRYNARTKVQRLPIEAISRASADQRAGRCGRVADGVCIRLYSREDYENRPPFTEPEIQRSNLAGAILQMKSLGLGAVEEFPFLDPPGDRAILDGVDTLEELGALDARGRLTAVGEELARLPIDPRIGRMILASREEKCRDAVLIIAAALSVQDPRERPFDAREEADRAHSAFHASSTHPTSASSVGVSDSDQEPGASPHDPDSDFLVYLNLWKAYHERARHLSSNKLRQWCRSHYLSPVRMREWRDIHHQLSELVGSMERRGRDHSERGTARREPAGAPSYAALHRAVLAGLLSNVATLTDRFEYTGPRGVKCSIFPGSLLFRRQPRWIMAAEVVGAPRLFARTAARISPGWIEKVGAHLVKRIHSEPYWNERMAQVWASERVTFMGLELIAHRRVHFGSVDPVAARHIFIQRALVEGESWSGAPFARHNRQLLAEAHELQARFRRHDLMADSEAIFDFFDARIPANVYSGRAFEQWLKGASRSDPRALFMTRADLLPTGPGAPSPEDYPDAIDFGGTTIALEYRFQPGEPADGVTLVTPLESLGGVRDDRCRWLVPGLLREKVIALMRTLPKPLRRLLVPVPEYADRVMADPAMAGPHTGATRLPEALAAALVRLAGEPIDPALLSESDLPDHLRMNFRVEEGRGAAKRTLAEGRDLAALRVALRARLSQGLAVDPASGASQWNRDGILSWDFDELPGEVQIVRGSIAVRGFPAIVDPSDSAPLERQRSTGGVARRSGGGVGGGVSLRVMESREHAERATRRGLRRLFFLHTRDEVRFLIHNAPGYERLALQYGVIAPIRELDDGLGLFIAERVFLAHPGPIRSRQGFDTRLESAWHTLGAVATDAVAVVAQIMEAHHALTLKLAPVSSDGARGVGASLESDIRGHIDSLLSPGFLATTPGEWLVHYPRYLRADMLRLDKLSTRGRARDAELADQVRSVMADWRARVDRRREEGRAVAEDPELERFRWLIEEWRVSLFAQELGSVEPISLQRLQKRWAALGD